MAAEINRKVKEEKVATELKLATDSVKMPLPSQASAVVDTTLLQPLVHLPKEVEQRFGDSLRFLVNKHHQNWPMMVGQLAKSGGFTGLQPSLAHLFVLSIPPSDVVAMVGEIERMYEEAKITPSKKVLLHFIRALSTGTEVSPRTINLIESNYLCHIRRRVGDTNPLPVPVYEAMVIAYGKNNNLDKVNTMLEEMKRFAIEPTKKIFGTLLSSLVYRSKDHKQAVEIFDSMKFMSLETKPGTQAYQDMMVSHINHDDVEKAIDLYQDMLSENVQINQKILVALARGCSLRPQLKAKAWEFMFEIYNQGWEPALESFEYMIYLCARDGDLALARALYAKLLATELVTPRLFGFLLLAYTKYHQVVEIPQVLSLENGRKFRANVLEDVEVGRTMPFLPKQHLGSATEVMAESSAMWAYHLLKDPRFITMDNAMSYINIAAEAGLLDDFKTRFEDATVLRGAQKTRVQETEEIVEVPDVIVEEPEDVVQSEVESTITSSSSSSSVTSPILNQLHQLQEKTKVSRTSLAYVIALKAAGTHRDYNYAQSLWTERGEFRKTELFKSLLRQEKDSQDFQFANAMIYALVQMHLLEDAAAILLSTEYQFKWTWAQLVHLHRAAVEVDNTKIAHTVRQIAKRAQIKHAGKIRRKDFKKYQMQRGY